MADIFQKYYADLADAIKEPSRLANKLSSGSNPVIGTATRDRVHTAGGSAYDKACTILGAISGRLSGDGSYTEQCETLRTVCSAMMDDSELKPLATRIANELPGGK